MGHRLSSVLTNPLMCHRQSSVSTINLMSKILIVYTSSLNAAPHHIEINTIS